MSTKILTDDEMVEQDKNRDMFKHAIGLTVSSVSCSYQIFPRVSLEKLISCAAARGGWGRLEKRNLQRQ